MVFEEYKKELLSHAKKKVNKDDTVVSVEPGSLKSKWAFRPLTDPESISTVEIPTCSRLVQLNRFSDKWERYFGIDAIEKSNLGGELTRFIQEGVVSNEDILEKFVKHMHDIFIGSAIESSENVLLVMVLPPLADGDRLKATIECFREYFPKILTLDEVTAMLNLYPTMVAYEENGAKRLEPRPPTRMGITFGANTIDFGGAKDGYPVFDMINGKKVPIFESVSEGAGDDVDLLIQTLITEEHGGVKIPLERVRMLKEEHWNKILISEKEVRIKELDTQHRWQEILLTLDLIRRSLEPTAREGCEGTLRFLDKLEPETRTEMLQSEIVAGGGLINITGLASLTERELQMRGYNYHILAAKNPTFDRVIGAESLGKQFISTYGK